MHHFDVTGHICVFPGSGFNWQDNSSKVDIPICPSLPPFQTYISFDDEGSTVLDLNGDDTEDVIYPVLTGGQQSQTLVAGLDLGFQNVKGTFNTHGLICPEVDVFFCIRLEKDEEESSSKFTLSSPEEDRTTCMEVECTGILDLLGKQNGIWESIF